MTASHPQLNEADLELLSAYIDNRLTGDERRLIEQRLRSEPELQRALDELNTTVQLLRDLERVKPPRSFTLDPGVFQPRPSLFARLTRFAPAAMVTLLVCSFAAVLASSIGGPRQAAAPGMEMAAVPTSNAPMTAIVAVGEAMEETPAVAMRESPAEPTAAPMADTSTMAPMPEGAVPPTANHQLSSSATAEPGIAGLAPPTTSDTYNTAEPGVAQTTAGEDAITAYASPQPQDAQGGNMEKYASDATATAQAASGSPAAFRSTSEPIDQPRAIGIGIVLVVLLGIIVAFLLRQRGR